jgi:glyoxylase-like metal-dependent hydrolase (beta-lactamase superfamily II)
MKDERSLLWESLDTLTIRVPDITFKDEIKIGPSGEITVRHTGGHTSGSSVVASDFYGVVFVGDLVFEGQFPYAGDATCNPDKWIDVLEEITSESFDHVVPGHGPVCTTDDVEAYAGNLRLFRDSVKRGIAEGLSSEELVRSNPYPESWTEGIDRWGEVSVRHWFDFYSD